MMLEEVRVFIVEEEVTLRLPDYVGPAALGLKMGVIVPGMDLTSAIADLVQKLKDDTLLTDNDILCVTESIVARSQENYVTVDDIASEVQGVLGLEDRQRLGVVFPIASRNRFSLILRGLARAVRRGELVLQLSWPFDEVGNQIAAEDIGERLGKRAEDCIHSSELVEEFVHPVTAVNYIELYREIIESEGAQASIILANDPREILSKSLDGVIAADIHTRAKTQKALREADCRCISLVDICSRQDAPAWSEWGLLGSNMSSGERLKLAPKDSTGFAVLLQERIYKLTGNLVEVLVYGDGAYKDPTTGIYELADPQPVFGSTAGFQGVMREGVKYKYLADLLLSEGKSETEIEDSLTEHQRDLKEQNQMEAEGTTPRQLGDVVASLADLVSGSADAGTPVVLVKGFIKTPAEDNE